MRKTIACLLSLVLIASISMFVFAEDTATGDASGDALKVTPGESSVVADDKAKINAEVAKTEGASVAAWYDIVREDPNDTAAHMVTLTNAAFVAEEGYEWHVYYVHNGVFHDLGAFTPSNGSIVFTSSDFSTYAVVKVPVKKTSTETTPSTPAPAPAPAYTIVNTGVEG